MVWRIHGRRTAGATIALAAVIGVLAIWASLAHAAALTKVSWTVSNSQVGATSASYTFSFKTATVGTIKSVTMSVPSGTAGTAAVGSVYGLGAGTISLSGGNLLTYTVTSAISVPAGTRVYLTVTGLTNTATAGAYTSSITTRDAAAATIDGPTASQSVTFGPNATAVSVSVGSTLIFTNDCSAFSLGVDPTGTSASDSSVVNLTVQTNAASGYSLTAADTVNGLYKSSAPTSTIPRVASGGVGSFPATGFGAQAVASGGTLSAPYLSSNWVGYLAAGQAVMSHAGPTGAGADTLSLTNQVGVDFSVPAGQYTDTITYTVTPSY
jgi:hypothetical protein